MKTFYKNKTFWVIAIILIVIIFISVKNIKNSDTFKVKKPIEKQLLQVKTVEGRKGLIRQFLIGEGTTRAVKREFLKFDYPGKVTFIGKDASGNDLKEGSRVKPGQLLAQIDKREQSETMKVYDADIEKAKQSVASAFAGLEQAEKNNELAVLKLERAKRLYDKEAISALELEAEQARYYNAEASLKTARANLKVAQSQVDAAIAQMNQAKIKMEKTSIYAPFDGIVSYLNIKTGDYTAPEAINTSSEQAQLQSTPIVVIDPDIYEITLNLPSYESTYLRVGQPAFLTWGDFSLSDNIEDIIRKKEVPIVQGFVYSVNPAISPSGRTIQAKIRTLGGAKYLKDGMFVTCWIIVKQKKDAIIAPGDSLIYRKDRTFVFVVDPKTKVVERKEVKEGIFGMKDSEIIKGIKVGDLLVTEGRHRLVEGTKVQIIDEKGDN
ncbi:MAG: efflux RND transporter periplasmic adaptor subunit [Cyanobacteriota bacterium]